MSSKCPSGTFPYVIKSGDTFYKLAQRYNTSVDEISTANPGVDSNNLKIGLTIRCPGCGRGRLKRK